MLEESFLMPICQGPLILEELRFIEIQYCNLTSQKLLVYWLKIFFTTLRYKYIHFTVTVLITAPFYSCPFNPLKPELNPICYLLALLGAHHFLHVSRIRVKLLTFRLLMSYVYGSPILDVSRSHTMTQHSR